MKKFLACVFAMSFFWIATAVSSFAQSEGEKLDQVLQNQSRILADLDQMKEELRVIKVRATQT